MPPSTTSTTFKPAQPKPSTNLHPSTIHDIGQLFGHALNALPGHSTLGSNITNPNVNYQGSTNPGTPSNNYHTPTPTISPSLTTEHLYGSTGTDAGTGGAYSLAAPSYTTGQQSLLDSLPSSLSFIRSTAGSSANKSARDYHTSILDFIDSLTSGQHTINQQGEQNELSRIQGTRGVLGMVGQGIKSGGTLLANRNAGTSSATEALARAYGTLGRSQQAGVNNQYAQGQNAIQNTQDAFNLQTTKGVRDLQTGEKDAVDQIVQDAQTKLADLDSQLINASLPDRINIEAEKQKIRDNALATLGQYDSSLTSGVAGVTPATADANRLSAQQLSVAGTPVNNPFDFTSAVPAQFQGTGQFASDLPIFTYPYKSKQTV